MIDKSKLDVVTSPKLFTDNNFERIDEEGLLSQKIFGPLRSWHCSCGLLRTKTLHSGQTCNRCGVKCTTSDLRHSTFAKIVLPFPIYKNTHKSRSKFRKIIRNAKYIIDPLQADLSITAENYLNIEAKSGKVYIVDTYDLDSCIPIKITGIYTFYLALLAGYKLLGSNICEDIIENIFDYELIITPPGTRYVFIKSENGIKQMISHDLNIHYGAILRLCEFDWNQVKDPKDHEQIYLEIIKYHLNHPNPVESKELLYCDQMICFIRSFIQ